MKAKIIHSKLTYDIRSKMLWPHIKNGDYSISVDENKNTFHLGTFIEEKIISIGTFIEEKNSLFPQTLQYRLRAMATDKNYQTKGAGKALFIEGVKMLRKKNIELLWCDARINAIPFYKSLQMKSLDKVYKIKNIGLHKTMYLELRKNH